MQGFDEAALDAEYKQRNAKFLEVVKTACDVETVTDARGLFMDALPIVAETQTKNLQNTINRMGRAISSKDSCYG